MFKPSILKIIVLLGAQVVWASAVFYGALVALPLFLLQLWAFYRTPELHLSVQKYVAIVVSGLLIDLTLELIGLVSFRNDQFFCVPHLVSFDLDEFWSHAIYPTQAIKKRLGVDVGVQRRSDISVPGWCKTWRSQHH